MDARQQKILYNLLNLAITRYKKSLALELAKIQIAQDYPMIIEECKRLIVKKYYKSRVDEVIAANAINKYTGEFKAPKGFSFIEPKYNPDIAEKFEKVQKTRRVYNEITQDLIEYALATIRTADSMRISFRKSFPNEEIAKKLDIFITHKPFVEEISKSKILLYGIEREKIYIEMDNKYGWKKVYDYFNEQDKIFTDIMKYFREIVKLLIPALYKMCLAKGESKLFYDIFDSAYLDAANSGIKSNNIEEALNDAYKTYGLPVRKHKYAHYIIPKVQETPSTSISPKPTTTKTVSNTKTKTSSVTKPSTIKVASAPTKVVEKTVVETIKKVEPVIPDTPVNILDISTKTKVGKYYRIETVENKAKKIYIDDSVSEIAGKAFRNCTLLEEITLGKNLQVLEFGLFDYKLNLKKVNFVEGLVEIKNNVFDNSGLTGYHKLPESLKNIGRLAFNVKRPDFLELSLSKETELAEKAIHRLVKLEYYEPTKSKTKATPTSKKTTNTSVVTKTATDETITFSPEIEENYKKGEQIYNKYSGKKKMLEAAKLMEPKALSGDLEACELVLKAYTYAEKFDKADKYVEPFIKQKKADMIYWFADHLTLAKGFGNRMKELFLIAAENGIIDAYENVAFFYYGFKGTPQDYKKAMEYYLKGANLGSAICLRNLADIYSAGLEGVVKPNKTKYLEYVKKAAEAGDSVAQYWLGCFYFTGKNGFPVDKKQANYWFEKSANNPKEPSHYAQLALQGDYSQIK